MTKRFWFVTVGAGVLGEDLAGLVLRAAERRGQGPSGARPQRAAVSIACALGPLGGAPPPVHDAVVCEWFADGSHLARFEDWLTSDAGQAAGAHAEGLREGGVHRVVVADEEVRRGADWLERRWRAGGAVWKHMALAVRAEGLSPAEASARWRAQAGQVGGAPSRAPTVIPEEVRGRAYVQNHPRPRAEGAWAYDAVNEVYFDDVEGLARRVAWFAAHADAVAADDTFGQSWFLATRETVCFDATRG
ncbi:MAG TPA: hypothetical protein VEG62_10035 [Acidimicrobiales bacterium]|nr:hypothetical protein [Acidimicrobiales bacterium]